MSDYFKPGHFCWWDLSTNDPEKAKTFYSTLFGWTPRDIPVGENQTYTMLEKDGKQAAALSSMQPELAAAGVPPHWSSYIGVESVDQTVARARELNATVLAEPFDVMTEGRMAVLQDPTGAQICVWEPKNHRGAQHMYEPGGVVWNELATTDAPAAGEFYGNLFGYDVAEMPMEGMTYRMLNKGEAQAGGIFPMEGEMWAGIPPHWMPYFAVENIQASAETASTAGGEVKVPPTPIPGIGTFAVVADPTGAVFSMIQMEPMPNN
jgi:predicted enzyme related to lactoylglutathione lyase